MDITLLFPLLLVLLLIPLVLNGRRQRKQYREMQQLQNSLSPGDEVMTTSGLRATVIDTSDPETVELEIAPEVTTIWVRAAVRERISAVDEPDELEDGLKLTTRRPTRRTSPRKTPSRMRPSGPRCRAPTLRARGDRRGRQEPRGSVQRPRLRPDSNRAAPNAETRACSS